VLGILAALFFDWDLLTHLPAGYHHSRRVNCYNNLQAISFGFRTWASDHGGKFPFNVSTNAGGTRELRAGGGDGFDLNPAWHFGVLSNELGTPSVLVCPNDPSRRPAADFQELRATNVSYQLRAGTNANEDNPGEIVVVCPIDGNILHCGGEVDFPEPSKDRGWSWSQMANYWHYDEFRQGAVQALAILAAAVLLFIVGTCLKIYAKKAPPLARKPA